MTIKVFYNEIDPTCCAWLSNLMDAGQIRPGTISDTSIVDLSPSNLRGYDLAHFFAGIAGWDHALTLAGWLPDGRVWWTGSCPCQPFSAAGKGQAGADPRHLWPDWFRLIRKCRPDRIIGEQVAGAIGHGWLDLVCANLETEDYAIGAVVLGAHSVGAPHIRQRLWFVADRSTRGVADAERGTPERRRHDMGTAPSGAQEQARERERVRADAGPGLATPSAGPSGEPRRSGPTRGVADADGGEPSDGGLQRGGEHGLEPQDGGTPWDDLVWLPCRDGKARPTQPSLFPLADGVPGRVGRLRAYGNAIVPQVGAAFVRAYLEATA